MADIIDFVKAKNQQENDDNSTEEGGAEVHLTFYNTELDNITADIMIGILNTFIEYDYNEYINEAPEHIQQRINLIGAIIRTMVIEYSKGECSNDLTSLIELTENLNKKAEEPFNME